MQLVKLSRKTVAISKKLEIIRGLYLALIGEWIDIADPENSIKIQRLAKLLADNAEVGKKYALDNMLAFQDTDGNLIKTVHYQIAESEQAMDSVYGSRIFPIIVGSELYKFLIPNSEDVMISPNECVDLFANCDRDDWHDVVKQFIGKFRKFILKLENDIEKLNMQYHTEMIKNLHKERQRNHCITHAVLPTLEDVELDSVEVAV